MRIAKKLFFIILSITLNMPLFSMQKTNSDDSQALFEITSYLKKQDNAQAKETSSWIEHAYGTRRGIDQQLMDIANDDTKDRSEKIKTIVQLKKRDEQVETENNKSYFSNISTFTKAAAAFIVAAGIASYFYFMHPWGSSNQ